MEYKTSQTQLSYQSTDKVSNVEWKPTDETQIYITMELSKIKNYFSIRNTHIATQILLRGYCRA